MASVFRLQDVQATKSALYMKGVPPKQDTIHNPLPKAKRPKPRFEHPPAQKPVFVPYVGSLQAQITKLIEANQTVEPYNFAFYIVTVAGLEYVDPRPRTYWLTELERIWAGQSARYWQSNGSLLLPGTELARRNCTDFIYEGYLTASTESCGPDLSGCCPDLDLPGVTVTACDIGVAPTICKNQQRIVLERIVDGTEHRPYDFWVIM